MLCFRLLIGTIMILGCSLSAVAASLASAESADGQCRAVLSISPDQPFLSDTITLTLDVTCPDGQAVEFPPFGEMIGDLTIVTMQTTDRQLVLTVIPRRGGQTPIWAMTIQCGQQKIDLPAVELDILTNIDGEHVSLDTVGLTVDSIPVSSWYIYVIIAAVVLAALFLFWFYFGRKRAEMPEEIPPFSTQEIALRRLAALLESRKHESDVKGFFVELSDIVRWYVERLTGIRAPELTTEEFLHKIAKPTRRYWGSATQQPIQYTGSLESLAPFLESADFVKFAKHVPTMDEMMLAFRRAERFVKELETKPTARDDIQQ